MRVAVRIETERLVLRPWRLDDAASLKQAIEDSLDHLRAWLPWAMHEPETLARKRERVRQSMANFEADAAHVYGLFDPRTSRLLGCADLRPVTGAEDWRADPNRAREIGYWIAADAAGRGLVTEAVAALCRVGLGPMRLEQLEIQCDPANAASHAIARRLGFRHVATLEADKRTPSGAPRDTMFWVLTPADLPRTPIEHASVRATDRQGAPLL